ncbi:MULTISPECIES: hypothetical protein [unclassified Bartonella]|uniref:hypothetical protein n=1 Tax=unclassified Bartonella TaxID=2645622 RepID=UPI0035CF63E9
MGRRDVGGKLVGENVGGWLVKREDEWGEESLKRMQGICWRGDMRCGKGAAV